MALPLTKSGTILLIADSELCLNIFLHCCMPDGWFVVVTVIQFKENTVRVNDSFLLGPSWENFVSKKVVICCSGG